MGLANKLGHFAKAAALASVIGLSGCGASDDSDGVAAISGSIFASYVSGASVTVYDTNGNVLAGPVTTDADGRYSVTLPAAYLASPLRVVSSGGTFTDEATGTVGVAAGEMAAYVEAGSLSLNGEVHATPGSTIMHRLRYQHMLTKSEAETAFETAFGYTPDLTIAPTDATAPEAGASDAAKLAGLRAATFSQLASDLAGVDTADQFKLMLALAQDLSDGTLDGVDGSGAITIEGTVETLEAQIQNRFALALENFRAGNDATGLGPNQLGSLPFARIAESTSYRFEYVAGMMSPMEGKTQFKVRVTDAGGTTPQPALSLSLQATMYMATKTHRTPVGGCSESATPGTYDCTIFYLMPSVMNGMSMGYWQLDVTANAETVRFFPSVGMGMNGNGKKKLTAQQTGIAIVDGLSVPAFTDYVMASTTARPYFLFRNQIAGDIDNRTVSIFAAVQESMMSFPALQVGTTYNTGAANQMTASTVLLEFSTDGSSWTALSDDGNGYWSIAGITDAEAAKFYVRLTVNGEVKISSGFSSNFGSCEDPDVAENGVPLCNFYGTFEQTL